MPNHTGHEFGTMMADDIVKGLYGLHQASPLLLASDYVQFYFIIDNVQSEAGQVAVIVGAKWRHCRDWRT
jgi:hypothetical protein